MTDDTKSAALAKIREADPGALALWSVKGPKDQPGSITAVLVNDNGARKIVLVHAYAGGSAIYDERVTALTTDGE